MKNNILLVVFTLFLSVFSFANNETESLLEKANELKSEKNYSKAIKMFSKAIQSDINNVEANKVLYLEIANCFHLSGNDRMALRAVKSSIERTGAVKNDIMNNSVFDKEYSYEVWRNIESDYVKLRNKYLVNAGSYEVLDSEIMVVSKN